MSGVVPSECILGQFLTTEVTEVTEDAAELSAQVLPECVLAAVYYRKDAKLRECMQGEIKVCGFCSQLLFHPS